MARHDLREAALVEAEDLGDALEIGALALVQLAIGHGDLEERAEQLLAHGGVVREDLHDLLGVGLEALRLAPRLVPDAPHRGGMGVGNAEDPLERVDLLAGDAAVRLRHLGREHHEGDGDRGLLGFLVARADAPDAAAAAMRSTKWPAATPTIAPMGPPSANPAAPPITFPQMLNRRAPLASCRRAP